MARLHSALGCCAGEGSKQTFLRQRTARARFRDYTNPDSSDQDYADTEDLCSVKLYYLHSAAKLQLQLSEVHTSLSEMLNHMIMRQDQEWNTDNIKSKIFN